MNEIQELFKLYDESRLPEQRFDTAKYGFKWAMQNGLIFYPENYLSYSRSNLLHIVEPKIPIRVCRYLKTQSDENVLRDAARDLPHALLVLCGDKDWASKTIPTLANTLPLEILSRAITHNQLGDFLPYGERPTRFWDVFRKSALPAALRVRPKVEAAFSLFEDSLSQALYLAILRRYLFSSDALIPYDAPYEQYFAPVYRHLDDEVFIDCGAYDGDTLKEYLRRKNGAPFRQYIAFEPDGANFAKLTEYQSGLPCEIASRLLLLNKGVSDAEKTLRFASGAGSDSWIDENGDQEIACMAIDDLLDNASGRTVPTFIKMDLQGHEAFALYGARGCIAEHAPVLAISVYHFVQDLWELPLLIKKFNSDYKFYLRGYRPEEEYICYAVPPDRIHIFQA